MEHTASVKDNKKISMEKIAESVKNVRDSNIDEIYNETELLNFLEKHFNVSAISKVKKEFLKRDLKELQKSSLDLAHYSSLIKSLKQNGIIEPDRNDPLFLHELKTLFKKYNF